MAASRIPIGNRQLAIGNRLIDWTASACDGKTIIPMFAKRPDRAAEVSQALRLAAQNVSAGKPGEAVRICRNVLAKFPNDAQVHYALGVALGHAGQIDAAIEELRRAICLKPDLFEAHTNLGVLLGRGERQTRRWRRLPKPCGFGRISRSCT